MVLRPFLQFGTYKRKAENKGTKNKKIIARPFFRTNPSSFSLKNCVVQFSRPVLLQNTSHTVVAGIPDVHLDRPDCTYAQ